MRLDHDPARLPPADSEDLLEDAHHILRRRVVVVVQPDLDRLLALRLFLRPRLDDRLRLERAGLQRRPGQVRMHRLRPHQNQSIHQKDSIAASQKRFPKRADAQPVAAGIAIQRNEGMSRTEKVRMKQTKRPKKTPVTKRTTYSVWSVRGTLSRRMSRPRASARAATRGCPSMWYRSGACRMAS